MIPGIPSPWLILGVVFVVIGAAAAGYFKGRHDMDASYKAAALEAAQKVIAKVDQQAAVTEKAGQAAAEKQVEIRTVFKTITKEVRRYVPIEVDRGCPIPDGFVRLHDAAAAGRAPVPEASGSIDGGAAPVELSEVASTVAGNYGACHETRQQLIDLQGWIRQQQAIWGLP